MTISTSLWVADVRQSVEASAPGNSAASFSARSNTVSQQTRTLQAPTDWARFVPIKPLPIIETANCSGTAPGLSPFFRHNSRKRIHIRVLEIFDVVVQVSPRIPDRADQTARPELPHFFIFGRANPRNSGAQNLFQHFRVQDSGYDAVHANPEIRRMSRSWPRLAPLQPAWMRRTTTSAPEEEHLPESGTQRLTVYGPRGGKRDSLDAALLHRHCGQRASR